MSMHPSSIRYRFLSPFLNYCYGILVEEKRVTYQAGDSDTLDEAIFIIREKCFMSKLGTGSDVRALAEYL